MLGILDDWILNTRSLKICLFLKRLDDWIIGSSATVSLKNNISFQNAWIIRCLDLQYLQGL